MVFYHCVSKDVVLITECNNLPQMQWHKAPAILLCSGMPWAEIQIGTAGVALFAAQCLGPQLGRRERPGQPSSGGCFTHRSDAWAGMSERLVSAETADQVPLCGLSWVLAGFWGMSLLRELGGSLGSCISTLLLYSVGWSSHGLGQIQGEGTKTPCLHWRSIEAIGAVFYNHHKCPLNLSSALNHSSFEGRSSNLGSTDMCPQPYLCLAAY